MKKSHQSHQTRRETAAASRTRRCRPANPGVLLPERGGRAERRSAPRTIALAALLFLGLFASARAQVSWTGGVSTDWFAAGNWSPAVVPSSGLDVQINTLTPNPTVVGVAGAQANQLTLGSSPGQAGNLTIGGADSTLSLTNMTGFFLVGDFGEGDVTVSGGATLSTFSSAIGNQTGSTGSVTVTGAGSQWNLTPLFAFHVGSSGTGTLDILNGGTVTSSSFGMDLGVDNGASGTVTVSGADSRLTVPSVTNIGSAAGGVGVMQADTGGFLALSTVTVGLSGQGTLNVLTGADLTASQLTIGSGAQGDATLNGAGSTGVVTNAVRVGFNNGGAGTLEIENGATLASGSGQIGTNTGAIGTVNVGSGTWTITNSLQIGQAANSGTGTLNVLGGGVVSASSFTGFNSAKIRVDGAGSQLNLPGASPAATTFTLGASGADNRLDVTAGGALATRGASLTAAGGAGVAVAISGSGSTWDATSITLGGAGNASLAVSDQAVVNVNTGSNPSLTIDGANASLAISSGGSVFQGDFVANTGRFTVAADTGGRLQIESGGHLTSRFSVIGENAGANGSATVTGAGSTWSNRGVQVAFGGTGSLEIIGGGRMESVGSSVFAFLSGSQAEVLVSGPGTAWIFTEPPPLSGLSNITVGQGGTATMRVEDGAIVTVQGIGVGGAHWDALGDGNLHPGNGHLIVTGPGTRLNLNVAAFQTFDAGGDGGTGVVEVLDGAVVTVVGQGHFGASAVFSGADPQQLLGSGTLTVDGVGSRVTYTQTLDIGEQATGILNISNGGLVSNGDAYLGSFTNSVGSAGNGTATVTGAGSTWQTSGVLRVGDFGTGALNVLAGGLVTDTSAIIAGRANSAGTVLVSGAGSTWTSSGTLAVGNLGTATLTIAEDGAVNSGAVSINALSTLNIGDGGAAGTLSAPSVANAGLLHFNHTGATTFAVGVSGAGMVTKSAAGTTTLTGASTYTGGTSVNAGTLLVNGSLGATAVNVAGGATLGGAGAIAGPVTIANGGILAPGAGPGTLTLGSLTLNSGSRLEYELAAPGVVGGGINDLTVVNAPFTLDGTINVTGLPGFGAGTYRLFDYTGAFTDNILNVGLLPPGYTASVDTSVAFQVNLIVDAGGPLPIAYWNGPQLTPNGMVNGGTGNWDTATTNWTDAAGSVSGTWGDGVGIFTATPGTVTLTDNISYTGLRFSSTGYVVASAGGFALSPAGLAPIATDAGVVATILAPITGAGGLSKEGPGTLNLDGQSTYTGDTQVREGRLFVNGSIASPRTFITAPGLLGGRGFLFGSLFNSGTVSPGNSPGKLTVGGDYRQSSAGTLRIEVAGRKREQFDVLAVGGRAQLDGTLELVRQKKFALRRGDRLKFLTAERGVSGEFSRVVNPFTSRTILQPGIVYEENAVLLTLVRGLFRQLDGLTPNQRATARALDSLSAATPNHRALLHLDTRNLDKLPGDFDKIAPEELSSIFAISTSLADVQGLNLQRRADDIRAGASGFSASGLALQGSGPGYSGNFRSGAAGPTGDGMEMKTGKNFAAPEQKKWGAFLTGVGEWVDVGGDGNARGYDITTGGFTLGLDCKVSPNFALGVAAGYAGTGADLADDGRVWVNGGKLGLYATYFTGGFYLDAAVTGGYNSYDTKRSALQGTARGSTEGGELNVLVGTGYDWKVGALTIGPTATFQYTLVGLDGFTESGSLAPLHLADRNAESVRSALGFKASGDWRVGRMILRPEVRAAWQHEYGESSYGVEAGFAGGAGDSFLVNGPEFGRDSLLVGAGFAIQCSETVSTYLYYDGELGRSNYERHSISGGVRVAF